MSLTPFTVYDLSTGAIIRTGYCSEDSYPHQVGPGEGILPQPVDNFRFFRVVDGVVVPLDK